MAEKPKTKEEFIKFLDKEIGKMDEKITETLKRVSYPFGVGGWNYKQMKWEGEPTNHYYVNVKLITPDVKVSPTFLIDNEYVREIVKEMDIPEEWLEDPDFYEKFKKYLIYEAISEAYLPVIKDNALRLVFDLYRSVERSKEKLEELI
jgi:hypothetical protein